MKMDYDLADTFKMTEEEIKERKNIMFKLFYLRVKEMIGKLEGKLKEIS